MRLKDEMVFELRFFKKCFDEILKNNSDYSTKIYRKKWSSYSFYYNINR